MTTSQISPLDELERQVLTARVNREAGERTLERVPRWRFRRRQYLARSLHRRRAWEDELRHPLEGRPAS